MSKLKASEEHKIRSKYNGYKTTGVCLHDRIIRLEGDIETEKTFRHLDSALTALETADADTPITIKLKSYGGSVHEACALAGRIRTSPCRIRVEAFGPVMSAAVLLLAIGDERAMSHYGTVMHHEASWGMMGRHSSMKHYVAHFDSEEQRWADWMAEVSNKPSKFWLEKGSIRDFYMDAQTCLEAGIIDEII